ncbi:MAG: 3-phosphoshikimate 1-carboxyvinyltransferase [Campylobacteraceae bacterium]|jgi:3-phosphoshikimate 1-carboxyvinyltransferase|nr:3-phosphoshikimate 1-carboxyvinyltransferase [Campylobacteraceae bacterium]MBT3882216.1 3-phosphoshikimate 1-carboxyvinyltransferase [Campylobacteraceae bacterium]MBT4030630.1 3-phosphoshikimate 1-carboxyvinyltransferase [Campylobacteraceae bacterium]MBT4178790.1 3-phosphoshikimate 1-carboxyvinyltransferase [Campylobacteraceae bacterium]MBT4571945.1 3-phosphoshikimate 1-carboxyvinyltransferase [Campylobacteraceae bacterium]
MDKLSISKLLKPFNIVIDNIASDKSISHRCAMFSLLSNQPSTIQNYLRGEDTMDSLNIAAKLGATIEDHGKTIIITPPEKLTEPDDILDCGNAGTGMRLYAGLLAGTEGSFVLTGDKYLRSRPMKRVANPLRDIGAKIDGREDGNKAPLHIRGGKLKSFKYHSPIDSAQVKSALILASLRGDEPSFYKENLLSRDHTERMLSGMGVNISTQEDGWIKINPIKEPLKPLNITVPTDPSSAFFFAVAAAITPKSKVTLKNLTLNPTRIEAYKVLEKMGAKITYIQTEDVYEPLGDIIVEHNELHGVEVSSNIAWLIDELPALSIAMSIASSPSTVKNAEELRVKESDRISAVVNSLGLCGVKFTEFEDGYTIEGNATLNKATINSHGDHRIAMSFAIAGLLCDMEVEDTQCIETSFPNFMEILESLRA